MGAAVEAFGQSVMQVLELGHEEEPQEVRGLQKKRQASVGKGSLPPLLRCSNRSCHPNHSASGHQCPGYTRYVCVPLKPYVEILMPKVTLRGDAFGRRLGPEGGVS